jgi:hypothetical protein
VAGVHQAGQQRHVDVDVVAGVRPAGDRATSCTTPTATACSPADSAHITARRSWDAP